MLELQNGVTINSKNNNITNFNFSKSDFTLDQLDTDIVKVDKLQETSTFKLIKCLKNYMNKDLTIKKNQIGTFFHNCNIQNLDNIFKELYKRFVLPLYIPVLILISLILILKSKENVNYSKYRFIIFIFGFGIMVLSEASLKFIDNTFYSNIKLILMPIITFSLIYIMINIHLKVKR